jgi:hypothetical protein
MKQFSGSITGRLDAQGRLKMGNLYAEILHNVRAFDIGASKILIMSREWRRTYNTETGLVVDTGDKLAYQSLIFEDVGPCMVLLGYSDDFMELGVSKLRPDSRDKAEIESDSPETAFNFPGDSYIVAAAKGVVAFASLVPSDPQINIPRSGTTKATPYERIEAFANKIKNPDIRRTRDGHILVMHDEGMELLDPSTGDLVEPDGDIYLVEKLYQGEGVHVLVLSPDVIQIDLRHEARIKIGFHWYTFLDSWGSIAIARPSASIR